MTDVPAVPPAPAELAPYVRALGTERTVALIMELGGAPLYFAGRASRRSRVATIVGADGVEALAREIGKGTSRVPLCKRWIAQYLSAHGLSAQEIARRMHVTDVTVRAYLRGESAPGKLNKSPDQLKLFPAED